MVTLHYQMASFPTKLIDNSRFIGESTLNSTLGTSTDLIWERPKWFLANTLTSGYLILIRIDIKDTIVFP